MTSEMRRPMTMPEIERRLRFAAPDEPAVLPRLVLPTDAAAVLGASLRIRSSRRQARDLRYVYAVAALLLALAAAVAAGAIRLLQDAEKPLGGSCNSYADVVLDPHGQECRPVAIPDGWVELGAGQLFPGTGTEPGLAGEIVSLVMANAPLGTCASPGGPMPTGIVTGSNEIQIPDPTPDAGLACVRSAALPSNGIRVEVVYGQRSLGVGPDGFPLADLSEPTEEAGWTEEVDGRPARLTVAPAVGPGQPAETRTWDILQPGSVESVLRIRAAIAGPDLDAGRAAVQRVIDAVEFKQAAPALEEGDAQQVLREVLDDLDREAREISSDFYGCFPRAPGSKDASISGGPSGPLASSLDVKCTSDIEASRAGVWRIALAAAWPGMSGGDGDTLRTEYFSTGERFHDHVLWSGGYFAVESGRRLPDEGFEAWFPNSGYQLPAELDGPLNLPPGSIVKVLWPGESTITAPGAADDSLYPGMVNRHLLVVDGPELVDGEEWYRVQQDSAPVVELGWIRGTRDGRPQLEVVQPVCPDGDLTVGDLTWLIAAERVQCFGSAEIVLAAGVLTSDEAWGEPICEGPCPDPLGTPAWLTSFPRWTLYGAGGASGAEPGMHAWLDPSVQAPEAKKPYRIRGHFDDPAAANCQLPNIYGEDHIANPALDSLVCRERFVITALEPR